MTQRVVAVHLLHFSTTLTASYHPSLHYSLPISGGTHDRAEVQAERSDYVLQVRNCLCSRDEERSGYGRAGKVHSLIVLDRKSTRLNSSHRCISYAVFCL